MDAAEDQVRARCDTPPDDTRLSTVGFIPEGKAPHKDSYHPIWYYTSLSYYSSVIAHTYDQGYITSSHPENWQARSLCALSKRTIMLAN